MSGRKVALAGIGKIAIDQHVPSIAALPGWELAATISRNGTIDGVEAFRDIHSMLEARPDIETVSLCVPPVPRFAMAEAALQAGRHVMLEKPPGASLAECHALVELAEKHERTLFATWHSREADRVDAAKAWLQDKQISGFQIRWKEDVRHWHPGQDWVFDPGGMGVFDPGINALSILTKILPGQVHVSSAVLDVPANRQTPVAAEIGFYYAGAANCTAELDWLQEGEQTWTIDVQTSAGDLKLIDGGARLTIDGVEQASESTDAALGGEYPRLYQHMTQLLDAGKSDVDLRPMVLVSDALALGERRTAAAFEW